MKKLFLSLIIGIMVLLPVSVKADEKVKVYIFEAGGCPYCELEEEYLEGLDSYGEKFEIIKKELYIDHIDWEQGKDYELGYRVATAFNQAGFENASYQGTPFVVISDLYAAAAYSQNLETVINTAYEQGDKDVVSCIAEGRENCLEGVVTPTDPIVPTDEKEDNSDLVTIIILGVVVVGIVVLVIFARNANRDERRLDEAFADDDDDSNDEEKVVFKAKKVEPVVKEETKVVKKSTIKKKEEGKAKAKVNASKSKTAVKKKKNTSSKK